LEGAVLLELLDHRARDQNLNPRMQRSVCEGRNRKRVNIAQVLRFDRAEVIAKTPAQTKAAERHE
jgi:hypothetical protein